jgi:hypothetical protein
MKLFSASDVKGREPKFPKTTQKSQGLCGLRRGRAIGRDGYLAMESDEIFCRAMVAFCRQHAKMQGKRERFWLDEAQAWADRLRAKRAFWHQFADKPELPAKYHGASPSGRPHRIIDRE